MAVERLVRTMRGVQYNGSNGAEVVDFLTTGMAPIDVSFTENNGVLTITSLYFEFTLQTGDWYTSEGQFPDIGVARLAELQNP